MVSRAENDRLCQVGPGTPMGAVMRRYWMPVCLSSELPVPDSDPVSIRLYGEDYIAFRDSSGKVGLLHEYCMHRSVSLLTGRVADGGIRCLYHGWKYAVDGTILDTPNNPDPNYCKRHKARAHPVQEAGGMVWAYVGPAEKQPPFRKFAFMDAPAEHRHIFKVVQRANYLQLVEQGSDSSHVGILHSNTARPTWMADTFTRNTDTMNPAAELGFDLAPKLEMENTAFGFHYAAFRKAEPTVSETDVRHVRVYPFVMPTIRFIPAAAIMFTVFEVAMDDENTSTYIVVHGDKPVNQAHLKKILGLDDPNFWNEATGQFTAPRENRYNQDRKRMSDNWSGFPGIAVEDSIMAVSAGPIADRTNEHLIATDAALVRIRRLLLDCADRVERGEDPIGAQFEDCRPLAAPDLVIKNDKPWQDLVPQHRHTGSQAAE